MTLTVGTDTYIAATDADTYFDATLHADSWSNASAPNREKALRMACQAMERLVYVGEQTSSLQALAWPRTGAVDILGRDIDPSTVPQAIKDAQCEWALKVLTADPRDLDYAHGKTSETVPGAYSAMFNGAAPQTMPEFVRRILAPFLRFGANGNSSEIVP